VITRDNGVAWTQHTLIRSSMFFHNRITRNRIRAFGLPQRLVEADASEAGNRLEALEQALTAGRLATLGDDGWNLSQSSSSKPQESARRASDEETEGTGTSKTTISQPGKFRSY
jgi:hypothetical protein